MEEGKVKGERRKMKYQWIIGEKKAKPSVSAHTTNSVESIVLDMSSPPNAVIIENSAQWGPGIFWWPDLLNSSLMADAFDYRIAPYEHEFRKQRIWVWTRTPAAPVIADILRFVRAGAAQVVWMNLPKVLSGDSNLARSRPMTDKCHWPASMFEGICGPSICHSQRLPGGRPWGNSCMRFE